MWQKNTICTSFFALSRFPSAHDVVPHIARDGLPRYTLKLSPQLAATDCPLPRVARTIHGLPKTSCIATHTAHTYHSLLQTLGRGILGRCDPHRCCPPFCVLRHLNISTCPPFCLNVKCIYTCPRLTPRMTARASSSPSRSTSVLPMISCT